MFQVAKSLSNLLLCNTCTFVHELQVNIYMNYIVDTWFHTEKNKQRQNDSITYQAFVQGSSYTDKGMKWSLHAPLLSS